MDATANGLETDVRVSKGLHAQNFRSLLVLNLYVSHVVHGIVFAERLFMPFAPAMHRCRSTLLTALC